MNDYTKWEEEKKKTFDFWKRDLTYRIKQEEKKYNNDISRENGVDWVEMVINKTLPDMIKEVESLLEAQAKAYKGAVPKKEFEFDEGGSFNQGQINGRNSIIDCINVRMDKIEKGE